MASSEGILWDWLKRHPDFSSPKFHAQRVENVVGKATPDIEGCYDGGSFHLETKLLHQPRKRIAGGEIRFERGQREWGQKRWLAGGRSYALIGCVERVWLVPGLFLPSLPERGAVTHETLDRRCILTRACPAVPRRDAATVRALYDLLARPTVAGAYADLLAEATPGIDAIALSPVEALLQDEGFIDSRSRFRFGQGQRAGG